MIRNIDRSQLEEELDTWKIFIDIMQDEYYTMKTEINRLISHKKLKTDILKYLEGLQTNILDNETKLELHKKSLVKHFEELKNNNDNHNENQILHSHQDLLQDEENIKKNLVELKKSFSEFIHLLHTEFSV